ncbi:MAG: cysteine synthase A [Methanomassiliicoccaceae archaeon]|nr:cysteine synthase A [Methanomassiliicoccaceae archaeon]
MEYERRFLRILGDTDGTAMLYDNILGTIGNTPVIKLNAAVSEDDAEVYAKMESFNPSGSVKDRASISMIRDAESKGLLKKGYAIVEPTSGNTGIGISMAAAVLGYKAIITMPDSMSPERVQIMRSYGAEIIMTPGSEGMTAAVRKAEEIVAKGKAFMPQQFNNHANVMAHYLGTAREILQDVPDVNAVVAGIGTGGTATGIGMGLRNFAPDVKMIGVEPYESPLLTKGIHGKHMIQGIGANFVPGVLNREYIDEILTIKEKDAVRMTKRLAKEEGLLVGISSGASVSAALKIAKRYGPGKKIVVILADSGERYMSTGIFD